MLAGLSAASYLRLERGRDREPTAQGRESLARVQQLDDDHTAHMMSLVTEAPRRRRRPRRRKETVPAGALKLLDSMVQPAFIEGRYFDILAANPLARALSPRLAAGGNQLRDQFLDPGQQAFHPEWESMTECFVGNLRQAVGTDIDDPRFIELIGELSLASARFRQLWGRHEVRAQTGAPIRMNHPQVGEITLNRERLTINGTDDLMLVVYHPDAGSADAEKLALLASAGLPTRATGSEVRPV